MKKLLKSPGFALSVCIIVILLSLVLGSRRSMLRQLRRVEKVYDSTVAGLLSEKVGYAANFLVLAARAPSVDAALCQALEKSINEARTAGDMYAGWEANDGLDAAVLLLTTSLKTAELSEKDVALLYANEDDYNAKSIQIRLCKYNDKAQRINERLSGPIPSLLRPINGVRLAPIFH